MLASTLSNVAIILVTSGALMGIAGIVVTRRGRKSSASPTSVDASTPGTPSSTLASSNVSEDIPASASTDNLNEVEVPAGAVVPQVKEDGAGVEASTTTSVPSVKEKAGKTRSLFSNAFQSIRGRGRVDDATWDELEETLLLADIGIGLATRLLDPLRAAVKEGTLRSPDEVINALREAMTNQLATSDRTLHLDAAVTPNVWLFVGVNGVGKTTTIGKIATAEVARGTTVLMAAGDTFRAAAAEQLQVWAERSGASFVRGAEGGDPASVIFDGVQSAAAKGITLVLGDTAGRLQNKSNLMEELKKVRRVADKAAGTVNEVLLVIDATTGQNGLSQAREFAAATDVTGVVLTKLDGSAKGGIVFAIETDLGIPVKLVGLGETAADLIVFDPAEFVAALFE